MSKTIRDPVHNIIEVSTDAVAIMDTWAFQRLRRIRQLGVAWLVYPAAEHSRFTHSVGVYHMSKRIMSSLANNSKHFTLCAEEKKLVAFAALLHDIGHAPFSHALETAIKNLGGNFEHEDMTVRIIKECEEITSLLNEQGEDFADKVCQVIDKNYPDSCVASIVSSQLDADRIDYSEKKDKILAEFEEREQKYYFWEDAPSSIAYKDLYLADVLEEIHVTLGKETIPLSAVEHSIVANAQDVLKKQHLVWYVKRERGCID